MKSFSIDNLTISSLDLSPDTSSHLDTSCAEVFALANSLQTNFETKTLRRFYNGRKCSELCDCRTFSSFNTQRDIWGCSEDQILSQMLTRESSFKPKDCNSSYFAYRTRVIHSIENVCSCLKFKPETFWLALCFADEIFSSYDFPSSEIRLIVLTCTILAAKMNEHNGKVPSIAFLIQALNNSFSLSQVIEAEQIITRLLNFMLRREIPFNFLTIFLSFGFEDTKNCLKAHGLCNYALSDLAYRYLKIVCMDFRFCQIQPSLLAAAILTCAQFDLGLAPWPQKLRQATKINPENFQTIVIAIKKIAFSNTTTTNDAINADFSSGKTNYQRTNNNTPLLECESDRMRDDAVAHFPFFLDA